MQKGFSKEADSLDEIIRTAMSDWDDWNGPGDEPDYDPHDEPKRESTESLLAMALQGKTDKRFLVYVIYETQGAGPYGEIEESDLILETNNEDTAHDVVYELAGDYPNGFSAAIDTTTGEPLFHSDKIDAGPDDWEAEKRYLRSADI